jgi:hypothetical protein
VRVSNDLTRLLSDAGGPALLARNGPTRRQPAVCRGLADRCDTQTLQIMGRLFGFDQIGPPTAHHD